VELNIPDILQGCPKTLPELANISGARPDRLRQVLRVLHNNAIFSYNAFTDTYSNNTTSVLLLSDHWTQWRNWVDLYGNEFYDMARGIPASCRKDAVRMPAQINYDTDTDMFTYFAEQGWLPRLHKTLGGGALAQAPGILEDYPWEEVANGSFLDIGGGDGGLVALLLRKHQNMRAAILDLPRIIAQAKTNFHTPNGQYSDIGNRIPEENLIAGDFLVEIPSFEVYAMKWCLHDWDDFEALKVMKNIRRAIIKGPTSRLVILESLLADGRMGRLSRYGDITMMVSANGQERNEAQWRSLAKQTGWEVRKIYSLRNSWPCAIELIPAESFSDCINGQGDADEEKLSKKFDQRNNVKGIHESGETARAAGAHSLHAKSNMSYLEPWDESRGNPFYRSSPAEGFESTNFKWVDHSVEITNARPTKSDFDINVHGFAYFDDPAGLNIELINALQENNKVVVEQLYYPRMKELIKNTTGASRVIIFDHTLRKRNPDLASNENPDGKEQPATVVCIKVVQVFS